MRRGLLRDERGQVFFLTALTLPVLLAIAALVVDLGDLYYQKRTLRGAADAAALAAAQDLNKPTCVGGSCIAGLTGKYSEDNAGGTLGNLPQCNPPAVTTNCYNWPYNGNQGQVEVRLTKSAPTKFARIFGVKQVDVGARAVAKVTVGVPPPYNFVAFNHANCGVGGKGENHTLLIKLGGQLTVTGGIYANSCSFDDGFDVFGTGGKITSPDISVNAGWETHDLSEVWVGGIKCPLGHPKGNADQHYATDPSPVPGCPKLSQPVLADPFDGQIATPGIGAPQCTGTGYTPIDYSPNQTLVANINNAVTTLKASGTAIQVGHTIQIDNERMTVTGVSPGSGSVPITNVSRTGGVATMTSNGHGLTVGTQITVAMSPADPRFDGTFNITAVTANTFSYNAPAAVPLTVTNMVTSANNVIQLTSAAHGMKTNDTVTVAIPNGLAFNGAGLTVTGAAANTFTYAAPTVAAPGWEAIAATSVRLTLASPPGLVVGDRITVAGGKAYMNNNNRLITAVSGNTITFTSGNVGADLGMSGNIPGMTIRIRTINPARAAPAGSTATPVNIAAVAATGTASFTSGLNVTVLRAVLGTTAANHNANKKIQQVITTPNGTAAAPAPCVITTDTTLAPGTYYGGIFIGSPPATTGNCTTANTGNAHVTLSPGVYVMAGGGFKVCGSSTLSAPDILIYNTNDASSPAGNGALGQIYLNTSGSVNIGPQEAGLYDGLTIWQDKTQSFKTSCDENNNANWDIALVNMASVGSDPNGPNGELGSISGTIYAPNQWATFGDDDLVNGRANLAVLTGCIRINGANSIFDFKAEGLFGIGSALTE